MFHKKCGNGVALDISKGFKVLCSAGINRKTLTVGVAQIVSVGEEIPTQFFCQTCGTNISKSELYFTCAQCSAKISTEEAFIVQGAGGIYCKEHAEFNSKLTSTNKKIFCINSILDTTVVSK